MKPTTQEQHRRNCAALKAAFGDEFGVKWDIYGQAHYYPAPKWGYGNDPVSRHLRQEDQKEINEILKKQETI